jgi:hypothetical protein
MTALVRMRLIGFVAGGRVIAPGIALLAVLGILYGGGASSATSAYGYSATMLFPIMALSTKLILDTEPDVQRHLARISLGAGREATAGLLAAAVLGLAICLVAMIVPVAVGAIEWGSSVAGGLLLGGLAHLLALAAAVALGALASRAVTGSIGKGSAVLASGAVLAIVLGLRGSIAPWLVPPVLATARALSGDTLPGAGRIGLLCAWAAAWCAVVLTAYAWLRRRRA